MITIIGAGIGGLATGVAFKQLGLDFQIFERSPQLKAFGAGIVLSPNAMYVLTQLGLESEIKAAALPFTGFALKAPNGKTLQTNPTTIEYDGTTYQSMGITRGRLHEILSASIQDKVQLSKELNSIEENTLTFKDGSTVEASAIIAADGIHSIVRKKYFPDTPLRYSGQSCWRALVNFELEDDYLHTAAEYWGNGIRFGCIPVAKDKVYFYTSDVQASNQIIENPKTFLQDGFKDFHYPIPELIAASNEDEIMQHDLWDFAPISSYTKDNMVLLGDAAHAMTPNLGQGAAQSMEDALILSRCIANENNIQDAFSAYEQQRIPKASQLVKTGWRIGHVTNWRNPFFCKLRNTLVASTPTSVGTKQLQNLMKGL